MQCDDGNFSNILNIEQIWGVLVMLVFLHLPCVGWALSWLVQSSGLTASEGTEAPDDTRRAR